MEVSAPWVPPDDSVITPTALTIAMVGESETRWRPADVLTCLAELAATDELVIVVGADEQVLGPSAQSLVAALQDRLPRHAMVVVHLPAHNGPLGRESALLGDLLDLGSLPIVVAPTGDVFAVAAELCDRLRADRLLSAVAGAESPYARCAV